MFRPAKASRRGRNLSKKFRGLFLQLLGLWLVVVEIQVASARFGSPKIGRERHPTCPQMFLFQVRKGRVGGGGAMSCNWRPIHRLPTMPQNSAKQRAATPSSQSLVFQKHIGWPTGYSPTIQRTWPERSREGLERRTSAYERWSHPIRNTMDIAPPRLLVEPMIKSLPETCTVPQTGTTMPRRSRKGTMTANPSHTKCTRPC
eukprot:scaffold1434_cov107-Cylindrotheca_fusiformis.AAC.2